jgi:hypothetical protein
MGRVARRRAVRLPSRSLITFPPRSTIIPDGRISRVRLEEQVLSSSLPGPSWTDPSQQPVCSRLPRRGPVVTEPQPLSAGRVSPHRPCSQGPFAPAMCYYRRHCSYGPMRQSRAHQRTSRLAVISPAFRARHLPRFDHPPFGCCRHPYAGRPEACICPPTSASALAVAHSRELGTFTPHRGAERSVAGALSGVNVTTLQ